ncbi:MULTISPECIES: ABC transporter ATP-binding protein [Streptomyces]|uniref:ABC-type quaternary amine transporter n=1 Tax=Streptomyces tsukubensis (strain DSM 42081 / NBRC 108919 / NRRL 18488 / 9993) TaxID=1114943 RepID=I2N8Q6_STRT9|nr:MULTISPECIES: ABC transporter ATP-binding protein [Streptomyces]AZK97274.1 ABC transporter ATP-binding protein [Streptomyces tsukubensis]EIF93403.1 iron ABC transporter ATpase [Streptomyces tsukubensis NRRL18488]MYS64077.1 ATP-binding cassette domain-containing protein [Streptomyces sp. SID5473]QKM66761.1 ABC transporter ATP-binding protein [Streptomyces tsukubensis NRRL18488]TAI44891.1 ABC transporter ATP-binding protein [Streptomyces tsukubensis]
MTGVTDPSASVAGTSSGEGPAGLSIRGVTSSYGRGDRVLHGLDLTVGAGELAAVLGPSGCGKTTLLRIIAGFIAPDAGEVALGDRVISGPGIQIAPERRGVGIVAQEGALFPHLSVARNVAFGLTGTGRAERRARTAEMLGLVGLAEYGDRMPHELSGGQQQRVALARALAPRPALVLLDEPFNALDSALRAGLRSDIRAALRAAGATAVLVTHDQEEALSCADRVAVIRDGRVAQCGRPDELYTAPADPWVASFVGEAVVLPAQATGGRAETALGPVSVAADAKGPGTVVLRPEQLGLAPVTADSGVRGRVTEVRYHGHDALILLDIPETGRIMVRAPGAPEFRPGDEAAVTASGTATFHPA